MYQPRSYRHWVQGRGLVSFNVVVRETDLFIRAKSDLSDKARNSVLKYRNILEEYIKRHPSFAASLEPLEAAEDAPGIIIDMTSAAARAGVGPMASVAGAMAQFVAGDLFPYSPELIVENGGDIYLKSLKDRKVAIYAGKSPLSGKTGLQIMATETPLSVCTSSGTVGHSLSFGQADAVVAVSRWATLADAAATAIGNIIRQPDDIPAGIELAKGIDGLRGVVIIIGDKMGAWGELTLCRLDEPPQP